MSRVQNRWTYVYASDARANATPQNVKDKTCKPAPSQSALRWRPRARVMAFTRAPSSLPSVSHWEILDISIGRPQDGGQAATSSKATPTNQIITAQRIQPSYNAIGAFSIISCARSRTASAGTSCRPVVNACLIGEASQVQLPKKTD